MSTARQATNEIIELAEEGIISWETLAMACLSYMSEDEVREMGEGEGFLFEEDDDDED